MAGKYDYCLLLLQQTLSNSMKFIFQIPAVQKNNISQGNENAYTLTQIGAFKKQLQLDKLNFDDDI